MSQYNFDYSATQYNTESYDSSPTLRSTSPSTSRDFNSKQQQSSYITREALNSLEDGWDQTIESVVNGSYLQMPASQDQATISATIDELDTNFEQMEILSGPDVDDLEERFTLFSDYEMPQDNDYCLTTL